MQIYPNNLRTEKTIHKTIKSYNDTSKTGMVGSVKLLFIIAKSKTVEITKAIMMINITVFFQYFDRLILMFCLRNKYFY